MEIREVQVQDAEQLLKLNQELDRETKFMLYEPGERLATLETQTKRIKGMLDSGHSTMLLAVNEEGSVIGQLGIIGSELQRKKHVVYIVIGILQHYTGQGVGTKLFQAMEEWCRLHRIHRIELTVMAHNEAAVGLYQKMGFEIEGKKHHSLFVDGQYVDELFMAKMV
ncbi:GNAT family protein [Paenibacillus sp. 453mf]|uniref:GNAT family N-acetyltransferase n=1 Tax=Paenibacillus sp. 453mf TaxID=1761874 RepID=UPI0008E3A3BC|nr:GNAT family protein [Paenibacillus sp. 453mf]SFS49941.1 Protein N-acetyltransferase, RimJ/RimL family [Paenibacillus sp. 453mf]